jgi:hypothetical protein
MAAPSSGDSILSVQASASIGAETGIKTATAAHSQCRLWVDSVEKVGRPFGFYAFGRFGAAEVSRLLGFAAAGMAASSMQTRLLYL